MKTLLVYCYKKNGKKKLFFKGGSVKIKLFNYGNVKTFDVDTKNDLGGTLLKSGYYGWLKVVYKDLVIGEYISDANYLVDYSRFENTEVVLQKLQEQGCEEELLKVYMFLSNTVAFHCYPAALPKTDDEFYIEIECLD